MNQQDDTRIILSLPKYLLEAINEAAKQQLLSRSGYIRQVLLEAVSDQDEAMDAAYEAGRRRKLQRYFNKLKREEGEAQS